MKLVLCRNADRAGSSWSSRSSAQSIAATVLRPDVCAAPVGGGRRRLSRRPAVVCWRRDRTGSATAWPGRTWDRGWPPSRSVGSGSLTGCRPTQWNRGRVRLFGWSGHGCSSPERLARSSIYPFDAVGGESQCRPWPSTPRFGGRDRDSARGRGARCPVAVATRSDVRAPASHRLIGRSQARIDVDAKSRHQCLFRSARGRATRLGLARRRASGRTARVAVRRHRLAAGRRGGPARAVGMLAGRRLCGLVRDHDGEHRIDPQHRRPHLLAATAASWPRTSSATTSASITAGSRIRPTNTG